jgi:hypothetical protein
MGGDMPTYNFRDEENNVEFEEFMTMSEREAFLSDHPHIKQLPPSQMNIVHSVMGSERTDDGWRENLSRIAEAHPTSELALKHGDKSGKAAKTRQVVEKWRKKRAADTSR